MAKNAISAATTTLALPVTMKAFQQLAVAIGPDIALCVRGRHAVGKSEGVHQAAEKIRSDFYLDPENCKRATEALKTERSVRNRLKEANVDVWHYDLGIPVVERRLSQMTEGDIIGLPFESVDKRGTKFKPVDWVNYACDFPVMLFLDERNRALPGVKQAVFQMLDSKAFYGNIFNDETRIVVAENTGGSYEVNQTDPAEVSRAATVELIPTKEEWIDYAKTRCNPALIDFIRQNPTKLEWTEEYEENKKYADRRSWFKLDKALVANNCYADPRGHLFYIIAGSMIGTEIAQEFKQFCIDYKTKVVTVEDVLTDWASAKEVLMKNAGMKVVPNDKYLSMSDKLSDFLKTNKINEMQAINLTLYMIDAPAEIRVALNTAIVKIPTNTMIVNKYARQVLLATTNIQSLDLTSLKEKLTKELETKRVQAGLSASTKEDNSKVAVESTGRGAKKS